MKFIEYMSENDLFTWADLLAMLSCRRTQPYWRMMGVPVPESDYATLSRASRKALGVLIAENQGLFGRESLESWNGFHTDLPQYQVIDVGSRPDTPDKIVQDLTRLVASESLTLEIIDWVTNDFRVGTDRTILIGDYFKFRFDREASEVGEDGDQCLDFARRMRLSQKWVESHFWIARNVLIMQPRSKWERFLDELWSTKDGRITFGWFEPVEHCVGYRRFRYHWNALRLTVGIDEMLKLVDEFEADCRDGRYDRFKFEDVDFELLRQLTIDPKTEISI